MSLSFFPSLTPPIASNLWFDVDIPCDDEAEVTALETEHQTWLNSIAHIGMDLHPLGKIPSDLEPVDSDEEDANDDSDSSHDDEEDEDMEDASREIILRETIEVTRTPYSPTNQSEEQMEPN